MNQVIKLNLIPNGEQPVFYVSQFDTGMRYITCELYNGDGNYPVPEGVSVELHCRKLDGNIVTMTADSVTGYTVIFKTTEQLTACNGDNTCEVVLLEDDDRLGTLNFILRVEKDPLKGGLKSASEIYDLTTQISDITHEVIGTDYYDKTEVNALLNNKADVSELPDMTAYYTKNQTNELLAQKADRSELPDMTAYYTKSEVDNKITDLLPVGSVSGEIATFTTSLAEPLVSLKAEIKAVQDLHGYDRPWAAGAVNKLEVGSRVNQTTASVTYTSDEDYIYLNGTKSGGGYADLTNLTITLNAGTYYLKSFAISGTVSGAVELYLFDGSANVSGNLFAGERTLTVENTTTYRFRFAIWQDGTVLNNYKVGIVISTTSGIDKFYPYSNICEITGFDEANITANGVVTTIDLGGTIYGGVLDVITGKMTVTHGEIASYSGESINEPWLSSMDVYESGATPTTGAQVVYPLTTPYEITLTPTQVQAVVGVNNIFSDTGAVEVKYLDIGGQ